MKSMILFSGAVPKYLFHASKQKVFLKNHEKSHRILTYLVVLYVKMEVLIIYICVQGKTALPRQNLAYL